jgi:hypothetical protein
MVTILALQQRNKSKKRRRTESLDLPALTPENFNHHLLRTVISLNMSFRAIENKNFRTLLQMLNPDCAALIPGRTKLGDLLNDLHCDTMKNLLLNREAETKVSLAIDGWTTPNKKLAFLGIMCYYITQDWKYEEHLIGFEPVKGSHTGQNLGEIVERVLGENDLLSHLLAITTDNAGNNNTLRKELAEALDRLHGVNWNKDCGTIPCLAHVLQLVVKKMVSELKIEAKNDTLPNNFDENEITEEMELALSFANTLKKVCSW